MRVDRRSYYTLIDKMLNAAVISDKQANAAREAFNMMNTYKRRAKEPTADELENMKRYVSEVLG